MKTEELLRYEAEFKLMQEALGTTLLVFEFSSQIHSQEKTGSPMACCEVFRLKVVNKVR